MARKQQRLAKKRGKQLKEFNRLFRSAEGGDYSKTRICFHEAGHCFNVTCIATERSDGLTRHWSKRPATRSSLEAEIAIKLGGKAAKVLMFGHSIGHISDEAKWSKWRGKYFCLRFTLGLVKTLRSWRALTAGRRTRAELNRRAERIIERAYHTAYTILENAAHCSARSPASKVPPVMG
uniref:Uncharacterized protein n=1 Tax=Globodera rostochiensis TaxID=31243 RepID=A0A914I2Z9_GLORO